MKDYQLKFLTAIRVSAESVIDGWTLGEYLDFSLRMAQWATGLYNRGVAIKARKESIDIKTILNKNNNGKQTDGRHDDGR